MTIPKPNPPPESPASPRIAFNWQDWLPYIDVSDLSDAEKRQLIETLWQIIISFVDLGWEIDCGAETSGHIPDLTAILAAAMVHSDPTSEQKGEAQ